MIARPADLTTNFQAFDVIYCSADVATFELNGFEKPLTWWQKLRGQNPRPTRDDIDFMDLRGLHDTVVVSRVLPDRTDMEFRIAGDMVNELYHGAAIKGAMFSDIVSVEAKAQAVHLGRIIDDFCLALTAGYVRLKNGENRKVMAIDFPLAPANDYPDPYIITFYVSRPALPFW